MPNWSQNRSLNALALLAQQLDASPPATFGDFSARLPSWLDDGTWATTLVAEMLDTMRAAPMRDVALRGFAIGPMWGVTLAECPHAGVTLGLLDSLHIIAEPDAQLVFDDSFSLTMLLAGGPVLLDRFDRSRPGGLIDGRRQICLEPGDRLLLDHLHSQICMARLERDAIFLRIGCCRADADALALVYDSKSGVPVGQMCADITASRMLALIDVAAASQRHDKAEVFAALLHHPLAALRWQAARHWLATDAATALPVIAQMAQKDPDPALRRAAEATCAMMTATA